MNILLLTAHSIAEHDDHAMLTEIGADVFSIGAYTDPARPGDDSRPPVVAPSHPDLAQRCVEQREKHAGQTTEWAIDWAKADLHQDVIDWADVIVCHHYLDRWIVPQYARFAGKRVIWRTCGQSDPTLERLMGRFRKNGLEIVRYSPAEKRAFDQLGCYAGEDALIRFGKDPAEWSGWTGEEAVVGNVTQNMVGRGEACGLSFWLAATEGLPARPAGPGSENLPGGVGALGYDEMREYLRRCRAYLYLGTTPASYTLGLIEAIMTGVPVVSIGKAAWASFGPLFEGDEIATFHEDDPAMAGAFLRNLLAGSHTEASDWTRARAIDLFGIEAVSAQWADFLGIPVREAVLA